MLHFQKNLQLLGNQNGQVLLIAVLIMVVALTAGLSIASRSIVQVKTAKDEADSQRALAAAESGVEKVLQSGQTVSNQLLGNNEIISTANSTQVQAANILLNNGNLMLQDDGMDIWLSDYPSYLNSWSGTLKIYWGTCSSCTDAALEIILFSGTKAAPVIAHLAFDPSLARRGTNNFSSPSGGGTINGQTFNNSVLLTNISNGLIVRVIPLYSDTSIGVSGFADAAATTSKTLPVQGKLISSTGVSGQTQRKISYFQGYESLPSELFYSFFHPK